MVLTGTFKETSVVVDERAKIEYQLLRDNFLLQTESEVTNDEFSIVLCNVRSLKKH